MGSSVSISHWEKLEGEIPAGQTVDIDSFLSVDLKLVKYIQSFYNSGEAKHKGLEMIGCKENSSVSELVYSKIGDRINLTINLVTISTEVKLRVVNGESYAVNYSILKTFL